MIEFSDITNNYNTGDNKFQDVHYSTLIISNTTLRHSTYNSVVEIVLHEKIIPIEIFLSKKNSRIEESKQQH